MVPGMNAILPAPNSVKGNTTKAVECFNSPIIDIIGSFIYTPQRVQASRITDIRQTLGNHTDQKLLVITYFHIRCRMADQLWFTSSLRRKKTEGDHLSLTIVKAASCIYISKTVICKPPIYMSGFFRS